jgi:hypothetical protein
MGRLAMMGIRLLSHWVTWSSTAMATAPAHNKMRHPRNRQQFHVCRNLMQAYNHADATAFMLRIATRSQRLSQVLLAMWATIDPE